MTTVITQKQEFETKRTACHYTNNMNEKQQLVKTENGKCESDRLGQLPMVKNDSHADN